MPKHVHAELIKAWADGAKIEERAPSYWFDQPEPAWEANREFRIKDPYRELKAAAADPTKQIRCEDAVGIGWQDAGYNWTWACQPCRYEIRDKPKPKVKMWQWVYRTSDGDVYITARFHTDATCVAGAAVIGPALWTEIEVDAP